VDVALQRVRLDQRHAVRHDLPCRHVVVETAVRAARQRVHGRDRVAWHVDFDELHVRVAAQDTDFRVGNVRGDRVEAGEVALDDAAHRLDGGFALGSAIGGEFDEVTMRGRRRLRR
jgi:hypothetical protein